MSYSIDRSRAVALEQRDGVWSLELEQLVRVNRNTFRPRRQRVKGAQAIVQHLLLHHGALVNATRQVLETGADEEAVRFELQGGGWVMAPALEVIERPKAEREERAGLDPAVIQEITALRARVEELEKRVSTLTEAVESGVRAVPAASDGAGGAGGEAVDAAGAGPAAAQPESAEVEPEPAGPPPPDFPALKMPALEAVVDLVKGLVGDEVNMTRSDSAGWSFEQDQKSYLAPLKADDGEPIGALVMNLEATIRLAGGMLMEPKDELDAQVEDSSPSDDILDAAGEVLNTLTSAVNKVSGNAHVRAGALEPLGPESYPWLRSPRARQDFKCNIGGLVAVVAR